MKPIRLPEPPSPTMGVPEIFEGVVIRRAVVIGNGFPGSENQSLGLVRALGLSEKHVLYRVTRPRGGINEWLHWLPVSFHKKLFIVIRKICSYTQILLAAHRKKSTPLTLQNGGDTGLSSVLEADTKQIVNMAQETYEKDGPLLVVASGRDTITVASSIKRLASENVFVVQIVAAVIYLSPRIFSHGFLFDFLLDRTYPRMQLNRFDLVITPRHDYYPLTPQAQEQVPRFLQKWITPREPPDRHVVLTVGALHQIDFAAFRNTASAWHDVFASLPKPLLVVNIGGPISCCRYGADLAKQLTAHLYNVLESCGSVRVSFSDRTPKKVSDVIVRELGSNLKVYIWDGQEPNPHVGHLAWADAFVITADSISVLSEACSTGKPVYVMGAEHCTWKYSDFHKSLRERGVVRPFTGSEDMSESWSYPPLNDTAEAASWVHETLMERGWRLRP